MNSETAPFTLQAIIFDLDGVLTDTAEYHYRAWKRLADEEGIPFTREDNEKLRGVSRRRSLEILLRGRQVDEQRAQEMMARKNRYYQELIAEISPANLLPGVAELLADLRAAGLHIAVATVSRNAQAVIDGLDIWGRIDALSDGHSVRRSKPSPDLFLHAAAQLRVPPSECLVVEDAAAGIEAAAAAGMHSVALGPPERFAAVQPDLVLPSLADVSWEVLQARLAESRLLRETWTVRQERFESAPHPQQRWETVFTIGNGYLGTRGSLEGRCPGDVPATLINGLFDGTPIVHTELANAPDWLGLELYVDGERFSMDSGQVLAFERTLDLRDGRLTRVVRWRSPQGRTVEVRAVRWASLADEHLCALQYGVTALDFTGDVELRAEIDGTAENPCTLAPSVIGLRHWRTIGYGHPEPQTAYLHLRTRVSEVELCAAMHLKVEGVPEATFSPRDSAHAPGVAAGIHLQAGQTAVATKLVAYHSEHDAANPMQAAVEALAGAVRRGHPALLQAHRAAWRDLWHDCDVVIEGDAAAQRAMRYNVFQLLIAAPRHSDRVSIPAKTLSGFGYRGHVFWDTEIFILPFFAFTRPEVARNLLMYRYHTLPGARANARARGYEGAMYAWESAADGRETTPPYVPTPDGGLVRIWCGEIEQHISTDVAYGVWHYWQITGDDEFMRDYGAEIVLDTAVFWGSRVEWNAEAERYEITDVIGPDEYHEHVDNNAFTNRMVRWHLQKALELVAWLRDHYPREASILVERLALTDDRLAHWTGVIRRLYVPYDPQTGLFEQFDGFFKLRDINWQALEPRTRPIQEVLGIEPTQHVQAIKQGDVLMLLYLLGDEFDERVKRANWDYYEPRTDHTYGSSLGPAIHAIMGVHLDQVEDAYQHFVRAAYVDLGDLRGNTRDGIHAASAGGVWKVAVLGFAGLQIGAEGLTFAPRLPEKWQRLAFTVRYRGRRVPVDLVAGPGQEE